MADQEAAPANEQDQPQSENAPQPSEETPKAAEDQAQDSSFTESYNPDELPEEARAAYESAYKRLQADYTRKTQEASQQRREAEQAMQFVSALRNPTTQAQALEALGLELDGGEDDDDLYDDPDERLDRLEQAIAQRDEQAQQQATMEQEAGFIDDELQRLAGSEGRDLDDREVEVIVSYALSNRLDDGTPNVEAGFRALSALYADSQKRYLESKKNAPVPGLGTAADKRHDLNSEAGRKAAMAEVAAAVLNQE